MFCSREAVEAGMCHRDYQYAWHWNKQGVAHSMKHRANLIRRTEIIDNLRPANVHVLRRKRA
jgi:hypothetical protein